MISIIIPVYQGQEFLCRCLDSIICQKDTLLDIIIVDDGSTDDTSTLCKNYVEKDSRIRYFWKENAGVSSARNLGLEQALGDWITFIDIDDLVELDYFSNHLNFGADLYLQNWRFLNSSRYKVYYTHSRYSGGDCQKYIEEHFHEDVFRVVWGKFFRRSIIEQYHLRFNTQMSLGEDTLFMMDYLAHCHSIEFLSTSTYLYYRPSDWNLNKHIISKEVFFYSIDEFWARYKRYEINSPKLVQFFYSFFLWKTNPQDSKLTILLLNAYPTVIEMKREYTLQHTFVEKLKYFFFKSLSKILY